MPPLVLGVSKDLVTIQSSYRWDLHPRSHMSITGQFVPCRYTKALSPVIALPTINVFISRVPS
jgi:hypothetical protein